MDAMIGNHWQSLFYLLAERDRMDTDYINQLLAEANPQPAEPIDDSTCHPLDVAMVTGLEDVFYQAYPNADIMTDENGLPWYVY
jgi:hypothetical protein